jgi:hypothetical protein
VSYMAAISVADKFKLVDMPSPTMEAAMLNAFATSPTPNGVTVVAKDQRAPTAPKHEDLFRLLKRRLAPVKLDAEWFRGGNGMISKAFANILENPNAQVIYWDKAKYNIWMTEASVKTEAEARAASEAEARRQQERKEAHTKRQREEAERQAQANAEAEAKAQEGVKNKYKHGYVYAYYRKTKKSEWIKIGFTASHDEAACYARIKDYIKQHDLPPDNWNFYSFVACTEARELETRLHKHLRRYRMPGVREVFNCSRGTYETILDREQEFIWAHEPDTAEEEARKAAEEIERIKREEAIGQARREKEEREAREKARQEAEARAAYETRRKAQHDAEVAEYERKAREEIERQAREKAQREARYVAEKAEREAREQAEREREAREVEARKREQAERERREKWERQEAERQAERDRQRKQVEREACEKAEARRRAEAEEQSLVKAVAGWKRQQTPLGRNTRGYARRSVSGGSGSFGFGRTEPYLETLKSAAVPLLVSAVIFAIAFFVHHHGLGHGLLRP